MADSQELFAAIREACPSALWSTGVRLAGDGKVVGEGGDDEEQVLRVMDPKRRGAATVVLYLEDLDWECDCESRFDACEHAAAAVIAFKQAGERGAPEPAVSRLSYRFAREGRGLSLTRVAVSESGEQEIRGSLESPLDPPLLPTPQDLDVDRLLSRLPDGPINPERLRTLLTLLDGAEGVTLDGTPIRVSQERLKPRGRVEDRGKGVRFIVDKDPTVREVVADGAALCDGDVLCLLGELELSGNRLERLPLVRDLQPHELSELVTEVLPQMRQRIVIDVHSRRLPDSAPRTHKGRPRVEMELSHLERSLTVRPRIVYGSPVAAEVHEGRLKHFGGAAVRRDEDAERQLAHRLLAELNLVPGRTVTFEGDDALRVATKIRAFEGEQLQTEDRGRVVAQKPLEVRVLSGSGAEGGFEIRFEMPPGEEDAEDAAPRFAHAEAVLRAFSQGLDIVALQGGGWAPLPQSWLENHAHRLSELLAARDEKGSIATHALPAAAELAEALHVPPPPAFESLRPLLQGFERIPEAEPPSDLRAELRPYQRQGMSWLHFLRRAALGGVLADDMGLGKTLQALCVIQGRSLVVCPRSVVHNWADEIRRFRPGLRVHTYHGARRELHDGPGVTLTTYNLLRMDRSELSAVRWDTVVLDEAQAIKNPDSQAARAAYGLDAEFRLTLSGTPVENRLDELWSQLHFTNPGLLGSRAEFKDRYGEPVSRGEAGAAQRLRQRIRPFVLRRLKREVAPELPPRSEAVLWCELDDQERGVYDSVRAATQRDVVQQLGAGGNVLRALEALLRLRQAACHSSLVPGQPDRESSAKVERLRGELEDAVAGGHKALVFSQWTSLLDRIEPVLDAAQISYLRLDGSTSDRPGVVQRFQDPAGPPVMLISLKAGGTGLNLTAADHVFLMDPWWNPAAEDQAADRAHRIGQDKPVMVYRMVAKDTVEERVLGLQAQKRALADAALTGAQTGGITRDELLALLE